LYTLITLRIKEMKFPALIIRFNLVFPFKLTQRRKLREAIINIFKTEEKVLTSLDYIFCSDEYLLKINQDFLKHNDLTDVITFDLADSKATIIGEIYISIERVRENAARFKVSFETELRRVMFHGALHLCGYKDKKPIDIIQIRKKEDYYLSNI
jgi:probable rRNA maturation factor